MSFNSFSTGQKTAKTASNKESDKKSTSPDKAAVPDDAKTAPKAES